MALVLENGTAVWQKVKKSMIQASPEAQAAFKGLREYFTTQRDNPLLQYIPFSAEQATAAGGTDLVGAACRVYGWYAVGTRTAGTTASFLALHAAATNGATTTTLVTARFAAISQQFSYVTGYGLVAETGLTISAATTVGGATESSAADAAGGFLIVGAVI